jgi:predicted lipoprotein with Yx(FWY)xxD motif
MSVAALALVLAGCGSSGGYGNAGNTPSAGSSSGGSETIGTSSTNMGTFLTGASGRSIYLWLGDHGMASSCSGACASVWPPVTTMGTAKAGAGVDAAKLGTIKRSDGTTQVTYAGHPLYYYASDTAKGQTNGEDVNGFGAIWYLVQPSGASLTGSNSSPSPSSGGYNY